MKTLRIRHNVLFAALIFVSACAARSGDILKDAGNTGIGLADGIHQLQIGTKALTPSPISVEKSRDIQAALVKASEELGRLPDFLEAADAARQVGQIEPSKIEETIAIVASITDQLNIVVKGVDVGDTAKSALKLAAQTRVTASQIMTGLAQLKAELNKE